MTRPRRLSAHLVLVVVAAALLAGCGGDERGGAAAGGADRLSVVTTVAPITSIAAAVIGDRADITGIVPEGTNSHTFEPRPSDAEALAGADVVFINGLQLEEPTRELVEAVAPDGTPLVELADETITEEEWIYDVSFPEDGGKPNPHLWTNPSMAVSFAEIIRDRMISLDPEGEDVYTENTAAFAAQVDDLDAAMQQAFATIPGGDRRLLTYHDAYAYVAEDYGFEVLGAIQPSSFDQPTAADVADLIDQVRETGVPAIFGSEVFPSDVLEQIGQETDVRYIDVLRDDDLPGEPGDPEHSWYGLMRFDYRTITAALGGDPSALDALDITPPVADEARYPQ